MKIRRCGYNTVGMRMKACGKTEEDGMSLPELRIRVRSSLTPTLYRETSFYVKGMGCSVVFLAGHPSTS